MVESVVVSNPSSQSILSTKGSTWLHIAVSGDDKAFNKTISTHSAVVNRYRNYLMSFVESRDVFLSCSLHLPPDLPGLFLPCLNALPQPTEHGELKT